MDFIVVQTPLAVSTPNTKHKELNVKPIPHGGVTTSRVVDDHREKTRLVENPNSGAADRFVVRRGKERETPKKKITKLKKVILEDRAKFWQHHSEGTSIETQHDLQVMDSSSSHLETNVDGKKLEIKQVIGEKIQNQDVEKEEEEMEDGDEWEQEEAEAEAEEENSNKDEENANKEELNSEKQEIEKQDSHTQKMNKFEELKKLPKVPTLTPR